MMSVPILSRTIATNSRQLLYRRTITSSVRCFPFHSSSRKAPTSVFILAAAVAATGTVTTVHTIQGGNVNACNCDSSKNNLISLQPGKITKEPSTGILFPQLVNAMTFVGCGVRVKWGLIKVYAVGTYIDPIAFDYVRHQGDYEIVSALLDPKYPRTIRLVMNRTLSNAKFVSAMIESLEPRMKGEDLDKLEEFKKLLPPGDLVSGAVLEMTIRGDTLLLKNSIGGVGAINSQVFCKAMCNVYYGDDAVSVGHRDEVVKGIKSL